MTSKETLQRLLIALAQVKVGNTSKIQMKSNKSIIYSFFWEIKITKKECNHIMNSKKL